MGYSHVLLWHDLKEKLKHEAVTAAALGSSPSGVEPASRENEKPLLPAAIGKAVLEASWVSFKESPSAGVL